MVGEMSDGARRMAWLRELGWGRCFIDRLGPSTPGMREPCIFDNGAYRDWKACQRGTRPDPYLDIPAFRRRLWAAEQSSYPPHFAVVPDIVRGGQESLAYSLAWLDESQRCDELDLPAAWPWYLAVQDGMTLDDVERVLRADPERFQVPVSGLFIGGGPAFKEGAASWAALAHAHGIPCHFGSCSTPARLALAVAAGCDSADSAFMLWTNERFVGWALQWAELTNRPERVEWMREHAELGPIVAALTAPSPYLFREVA